MNLIFGNKDEQKKEQQQQQQGQNVVRVSQPMAGGQHQPSQADYLDRNQLLPSNPMLSSMPTKFPPQQLQQEQPAPSQQDYFPMSNEPMAANEGSGGWGSW